jgi:hypothetical protein
LEREQAKHWRIIMLCGLFRIAALIFLLVACGRTTPDWLSSRQTAPSAATAVPTQRQAIPRPPTAVSPSSTPPVASEATPNINYQAFKLLWTIDGTVLSGQEIEACLQATPCITEHDPGSPQALAIVRLYQLAPVDDPYPGVLHVQLMRGEEIVHSDYGAIRLSPLQYYWLIETCDMNLLINARTGEAAGPAHEYIMCTPMEPAMPSIGRHDVPGNAS